MNRCGESMRSFKMTPKKANNLLSSVPLIDKKIFANTNLILGKGLIFYDLLGQLIPSDII